MATTRAYGWRPDLPDHRDHVFALAAPVPTPKQIDLRPAKQTPGVWNQGQAGSCTGHGAGACISFVRALTLPTRQQWTPSRLFLYFNGRDLEGSTGVDAGASIRDVVKAASKLGVPPEKLWPYDEAKVTKRPSAAAYKEAAAHVVTSYLSVGQDLSSIRQCLAAGFPLTFGFSVYESFESPEVARTGVMPMPGAGERMLGGHCVAAWGYDDARKVVICRNSWGARWGDKGYFYMPYALIENPDLACDFWTIRADAS